MKRVAIIGSGPTGIYTLKGLIASPTPISITIFEVEADAGKGTPYHPHINDQAMLANIASIELPAICETLVEWLRRQPTSELDRLNIVRENIQEREFYPRVVLGEFLQSQFRQLIEQGMAAGHVIDVKPQHRVTDIGLQEHDIALTVNQPDKQVKGFIFDHVVMATGHDWPETTEISPGYFISPWPASILKTIGAGSVGILGTSLSAIDALITVATAHGAFYLDSGGQLQYRAAGGSQGFSATLMSRKGLLPEADFYCDYPYRPLKICTTEAIRALVIRGSANLLDKVFELFRQELSQADPDYAASIGLAILSVETFSSAYFAGRLAADPFVWAASNLAEAEQNKAKKRTVEWRYAILRMHEVVGMAVPFLNEDDLKRFNRYLKGVFVDDYATVPHQSIQRLLALRRAEKLEIQKLGKDYRITKGENRGAVVRYGDVTKPFDAFIDATGQSSKSVRDLPFPTLAAQGVVKPASTPEAAFVLDKAEEQPVVRTGGIDLDSALRPKFEENLSNELYCAAIAFLLHKMPFVQGITSAHEIGQRVSAAILGQVNEIASGRREQGSGLILA